MVTNASEGTLSYGYGYVRGGSYSDSAISSDLTHIGSNASQNSNHTNFGNILFFDGHVEGFNGAGWFTRQNTGYIDTKSAKDWAVPPSTVRDDKGNEI
jgi:prepilin-type processing-associated H-X9-DG protein